MASTPPKYSIVIPILNGVKTFQHSLREMLKIDRDDIEWVISDNHSEDNLLDVIREVNDPRIRVVTPKERLPIGKNLEFAYLAARGDWQGHLGDDDMIFPSRFAYMDALMASDRRIEIFKGEWVRYHWPDFLPGTMANTVESAIFSGGHRIRPAIETARELMNVAVVPGGASWTVHRSVIDKVRQRCGFFASAQHVEFFAMRAACTVADRIAELNFPVWVLGRHLNSAGTFAFAKPIPALQNEQKKFEWSFEDPDNWKHCPFQFKTYGTISLDAALTVHHEFQDIIGDTPIHWISWARKILDDLAVMMNNGKLDARAFEMFKRQILSMEAMMSTQGPAAPQPKETTQKPVTMDGFGWQRFDGALVDIHTVADVPRWVESTFPRHFIPRRENDPIPSGAGLDLP